MFKKIIKKIETIRKILMPAFALLGAVLLMGKIAQPAFSFTSQAVVLTDKRRPFQIITSERTPISEMLFA